MKRELGIARCGLACCLCTENNHCHGCNSLECPTFDECVNFRCTEEKKISNCYKCENQDCKKGLLFEIKPTAFNLFIKRNGLDELLDCLESNEKKGIVYHRLGFNGDYDDFTDVEELIFFIKTGNKVVAKKN